MIGLHNIKNALAAISVAVGVGINAKVIKEGIQKFSGVKRRFNLIYRNKIKIFDDYAHHPVEITNVINSLKLISKGRIIAVHEPHRYSRVHSLFKDFIKSLSIADHVILLPVFSAGEKKIKRFESQMLVSRIGLKKSDYVSNKVKLFKKLEDIIKVGDNIVFLGAGPITKLAYEFAKKIENNESNK